MQRTLTVHNALKAFSACLIFLSLSHAVRTQPLRDNQRERRPSDESLLIYCHAVNLPAADSSRSRVDIHFRISYDFFVFVRNQRAGGSGDSLAHFLARADITMELLDSAGNSVARELMRREMGTNQPERRLPRDEFLQGIFSFVLSPGTYTIVFQLDDLESNRKYLDASRRITLRDFGARPITLSDVMFVEPVGPPGVEASEFSPVNLGGDVFYGRDVDAYLECVDNAPTDSTPRLTYSLYRPHELTDDTTFTVRDSVIAGGIAPARHVEIQHRDVSYTYRLEKAGSKRRFAVLIPLNGRLLEQGQYDLAVSITDGARTERAFHRFRVRWVGMPRSLSNPELAVDALEHIASKDEMSSMKSLFTKRRQERFQEFWKKRDPTPQTAFNEAMEEYYRRVDYAIEHLGTLSGPAGYKTDRGKVYVLYGHPDRADRQFSPAAPPREIWEYESAKKRFVFVDADGRGNYKLVSTENVQ